MGGFLSGGDKQRRDAQVFSYAASIEQNFAEKRAQRRSILQDIRQARMAQAYNEWAASSTDEYVTASGTDAVTGNIFSNFSGAYRYAIDQSESAQRIQTLNLLSEKLEKRANKRDQRAATAAKYITAAASIAGSAFGPIGTVVGAGIGNLTVRGLHGGKAAIKASNKQAISSALTAGASYASNLMSASSATTAAPNAAGVSSVGGTVESGYNAATVGSSTATYGGTEIWNSPLRTGMDWRQAFYTPNRAATIRLIPGAMNY